MADRRTSRSHQLPGATSKRRNADGPVSWTRAWTLGRRIGLTLARCDASSGPSWKRDLDRAVIP